MVCECVCERGFSPPKHTPQGVKAGPWQGKHCSFPWGSPGDSGRGAPEGPRTLQGPELQLGPGSGQAASGLWGWRAGCAGSRREGGWGPNHRSALEVQAPGRGEGHIPIMTTPGVTCLPASQRDVGGNTPPPLQSCLAQGRVIQNVTSRCEASIGQRSPFMMEKLRHGEKDFPKAPELSS